MALPTGRGRVEADARVRTADETSRSSTMAAMTKSYLVTGVGCRRRGETLIVPEGVQIIFYRVRPRPPQISGVRTPLDELMVAVKLLSATAAGPGESVPAGFCWERATGFRPSGVFRRSTGARVMDLSNTSARRPVPLDHIVRELATDRKGRATVIHWLVEPGDPEPVRTHWQVQRPPRLFAGDGQESGHAPLAELAESDEAAENVPPGWVTVSIRT